MKNTKKLLFFILLVVTAIFISSKTTIFADEIITKDSTTTSINEESSSNNEEETTTDITEDVEPVKIFFLGNSATYYNDMPLMVKGLATASGKDVEITSITASGYKLSQYIEENSYYFNLIKSTLTETKFDYIVVQDHREVMIQNPTKSESSFIVLKELFDKNGAQVIIYETQADSEGRTFKINNSEVFLDHSMMQYYLTKNYFYIGNKYNVEVSAAGPNYTRCSEMFPEIKLYNKDKLHPSVEGSYLAACTLYESIFNESAFNNGFLPGSEYDTENLLEDMSVENAVKIQSLCDVRLDLISYNLTLNKATQGVLETTYTITEGNDCLYNNSAGNTYSDNIQFYSLNDDVIAINRKNGTYTALNNGEAMIMAITDDGVMAMCNVTVKQPSTSLDIPKTDIIVLLKGQTHSYETKILPKDTTDTITWISDNPKVVSVDETGTVTAHKAGVANITASTESGLTVTRRVRVKLATPSKLSVKKLKTKAKSKKYANIKITWKKNKNATSYSIFRKSSKTKSYKKIGSTTKNYFTDKNRRKGRTYYYKVRAVHKNGYLNSAKSSSKSIYLKN